MTTDTHETDTHVEPTGDVDPQNTLPHAGGDPANAAGDEGRQDPADDPGADAAASSQDGGEGGEGTDADDDGPESRANKRIREIIAERKAEREALEEYGEYWRAKAIELMRASGQLPAGEAQQQEPAETPAPKLDDFDSTEKWAEAYSAWTQEQVAKQVAKQVETATHQTLAEQRQAEDRAATLAGWQERLQKFAAQKPDALAVIGGRVPITKEMTEVIIRSEVGPEVAYHLGANPSEAARIARMPPVQQAAAIGRLEARFAVEKGRAPSAAPPRRNVSKAPPPPAPIDGAGASKVDLENMPLKDFLDIRLGRKKRA